MASAMMPFAPLGRAVEMVAKLTVEKFATLRDSVTGPEAFDRSLDRCRKLAESLKGGLEVSELLNVLATLRFVYDNARDWKPGDNSLVEFLEFTGLRQRLPQPPELVIRRLSELLTRNQFVEKRRKLRWLRTGILDTAVNFSSFVDLR